MSSIRDLIKTYSPGTTLVEGQTIWGACPAQFIGLPVEQYDEQSLSNFGAYPELERRLIVTDDYVVFHSDFALRKLVKEQIAQRAPTNFQFLAELIDTDDQSTWFSLDMIEDIKALYYEHIFNGPDGGIAVTFHYYGLMIAGTWIYYLQTPVTNDASSHKLFMQMASAFDSIRPYIGGQQEAHY